jgi:hypothetical protein
MPFWLVYMETYGIDFLTPLFVINISNHHQWKAVILPKHINETEKYILSLQGHLLTLLDKQVSIYIYIHIYIHVHI